MKTHILKIWPDEFQAADRGQKPWELRVNDRNYQVGDNLLLREWDPSTNQFTGSEIEGRVTFLLQGGKFGLPETHCIMTVNYDLDPYSMEPLPVDDQVWDAIIHLYNTLKVAKPENGSPKVRRYAILRTQFQQFLADFFTWVKMEFPE